MRYVGLMLSCLIAACASTGPSQKEQEAVVEGLTSLGRECSETSVLALCESNRCELLWCQDMVSDMAAGQQPRSPSKGRLRLSIVIKPRVETAAPRTLFLFHNRSLLGSKKINGIPPPCPNCEAILPPGVRILP